MEVAAVEVTGQSLPATTPDETVDAGKAEIPMAVRQLGDFILGPVLGAGGMGTVYRGTHHLTGEAVAVKTVRVPHPQLLQGLRREVETLAALDHPGIVHILAHGAEPEPWYAMELVEGAPLQALMQDTAAGSRPVSTEHDSWWTRSLVSTRPPTLLSLPRANATQISADRAALAPMLGVLASVCETLAYLHAQGLVHRDLKPDNIMVQPGGSTRLVDFGLALWARGGIDRERIDSSPFGAGSLPYIAPEQLQGRWVDQRADLYSLGCIIFQLSTGRPPFTGSPEEVAAHHLHTPAPQLDNAPRPLTDLVARLLNKTPDGRPGYAVDVGQQLAQLAGEDAPDIRWHTIPIALHRPAFAGRRQELAHLRRAVVRSREADTPLIGVRGPSGSGKTRLLMELVQQLPDNTTPIVCMCQPEHVSPLSSLTPLLGAALSGDVAPARRLEESLNEAAKSGPAVLVIDDAQWADPDTLSALGQLSLADSRPGWRILLAWRSEEEPETLSSVSDVLTLERLDQTAVRSIASSMLGTDIPPADLVDLLVEHSRGQPFLVAEYLRLLHEEGVLQRAPNSAWQIDVLHSNALDTPRGVAELVSRRLALLSGNARSLVNLAAVIGRRPDAGLVADVLAHALEPLLAETRKRAVLEMDQEGVLRFCHDKIRESAYLALEEGERRRLHLEVARASLSRLPPARRAHHFERGGLPEDAHVLWLQAVHERKAAGDITSVADAWMGVLRCAADPDSQLVTDALEALVASGEMARAGELLAIHQVDDDPRFTALKAHVLITQGNSEEALQLLDVKHAHLDREMEADWRELRARAHRTLGSHNDSLSELTSALEVLRGREIQLDGDLLLQLGDIEDCSMQELKLLVAVGSTLRRLGKYQRARVLLEPVVALHRKRGDVYGECKALFALIPILGYLRDRAVVGKNERRALELAKQLGDVDCLILALEGMGHSHLLLGGFDTALPWYRRAAALARQHGQKEHMIRCIGNLGLAYSELGHYQEALPLFEESLRLTRQHGYVAGVQRRLASLARVHNHMGNPEKARPLFQEAIALAEKTNVADMHAMLLVDLASLEREAGNLDEALELGKEGLALNQQVGELHHACWAQMVIARTLNDARRPEEALEYLRPAMDYMQETRCDFGEAAALCVRVRSYRLQERHEDADQDVIDARAIGETLSGPRFVIDAIAELTLSTE